MSHKHDPKQQVADWWREAGNTPTDELEKALDALPQGSPDVVKNAILDAIYGAQSVQKAEGRWMATTRVMSSLFLLLIAIALGFIGWNIWQMQDILAGANKASSSQLTQMQVQSNALADRLATVEAVQLKQVRAESTLESLAGRVATAEAVQPTMAVIATLQWQYGEVQKALSATPTPSLTPTPTISTTLTVTPSAMPTQ